MKIISKYKDYYDYLTGVYGIDPKKVLDRTNYCSFTYDLDEIEVLYFCGTIYRRFSREMYQEKIGRYIKDKYYNWWVPKGYENWELKYEDKDVVWYKCEKYDDKELPYFICKVAGYPEPKTVKHMPILKELGFEKVMDAKECYLAIEEFISYKETESNNKPEDMTRFEAKGFDKKKSFRKKK